MKCTVGKEALLTHLQKVCNIVSRRPVLPILNNVRLEAGDNTLILKTTDPEITIRTELRADVEYSGVTRNRLRRSSPCQNQIRQCGICAERIGSG